MSNVCDRFGRSFRSSDAPGGIHERAPVLQQSRGRRIFRADAVNPGFEAFSPPLATPLQRADGEAGPSIQGIQMNRTRRQAYVVALLASVATAVDTRAQTVTPTSPPRGEAPATAARSPAATAPVAALPDYIIGAEDVLAVVFWREKDLSGDVTVRPDGKVTLPLINEIQAAGLTAEQLRQTLIEQMGRFVADPNATVAIKQINSRKVFITGQIAHPGSFNLISPMTVLQLIALAGGMTEFADAKRIVVMRTIDGKPVAYPVNYRDLLKRVRLAQNVELKPGDTVIVP